MNIAQILQDRARDCAAVPAIIDMKRGKLRSTSFAELESASARGALLLRQAGLLAGDTVLIFQPMSAELYICLLALFRMGITAMFLDPAAGREHIQRCCTLHPPQGLLASSKAHLLRFVSPALRRIPIKFSIGMPVPGTIPWHQSEHLSPVVPIDPCEDDNPALLTFTSGSTGFPKGAIRTHGFLLEQHRVLERAIELVPGEIDLTTLPVFALANLASGVTSLIPEADLRRPGAIDPLPVLKQIDQCCPTRTAASPAFLLRLCQGSERNCRLITGFRKVFTGGAPVFPSHLARFAEVFPGAEIVAVYGSTEAEPIADIAYFAISTSDMTAMTSGSGLLAGTPVREIAIRIMSAHWGEPVGSLSSEQFEKLTLPPGCPGEIVVSGGHVLKGYLNGVGDEETKFRVENEVWHRTGDCGYFDVQARLWLLGRASAVIEDARGSLYPFAVECTVSGIPSLGRSALVARHGKRVLFVEPADGSRSVKSEELLTALAWAQIDEIRVLRKIPLDRRHNAKIDYTRLP